MTRRRKRNPTGSAAAPEHLGRLHRHVGSKRGRSSETASAATTDNTTFFIEPAPFRSTGLRPIPLPVTSCVRSPRLRSTRVRKRTCNTANLHLSTASSGKPKTAAIAAFLGEKASYRQKACQLLRAKSQLPAKRSIGSRFCRTQSIAPGDQTFSTTLSPTGTAFCRRIT